ncbi:MAG: hypothetical protein AAF086_06835 [Planctomycetota bacterium]
MARQIKVQEVDEKAERGRRLRRRGGLLVAGLVAVAAAGGAAWYFTPPGMPESIDEARALVNSPRFERLSKDAKQPYYDVIREQYGSLDREERQKLRAADEKLSEAMRDARTVQMRAMLVQMAEMTPEEREAMMATFGRGRPGGGPPSGNRPERSPEEQAERSQRMRDHISDRMANGDSQMNQLMREMFSQKHKQK